MLLVVTAVIASLVAALIIIRFWLKKIEEKTQLSGELVEWLKDMGARVERSSANVDLKLAKNMELFNSRLDHAAAIMSQVQKNIGEFSEIGRSMKNLQDFLQSPKLRGNIGEQVLKDMLLQYLPEDCFACQYEFKNGEKVDTVIKTSQGLIPVDSKFPLENFRKLLEAEDTGEQDKLRREFERDVKKHIVDIAKKYILVSEGTVDYALMYIPAESVYYEIVKSRELYDFAGNKRVLPVSPLSFYAYMKAILMSFEGQRIQTQAKEIMTILKAIKKDYEKGEESLLTLTKHMTNAYNQLTTVTKVYTSLGQKISSTNLLSPSQPQEKLIE